MSHSEFEIWTAEFRSNAIRDGIEEAVLDRALTGLRPNASVIEKDRNQAEFSRPIWDYLDRAVSNERIRAGRAAMERNATLLDRIEARFGVPAEILAAIWGVESNFGATRGTKPVIASLATLAWEGRRAAFFERELLAALKIVQAGDVPAQQMLGSWAGAMGHMQFMPSAYLAHSLDFDGDGRRDIWSDDPDDALASAAAYLSASGWQTGLPWGGEVQLPERFDYSLTGRQTWKPTRDWQKLGAVFPDADGLVGEEPAAILLPAGHSGPVFGLSRNFEALRRYNASDSYVLAVCLLADCFAGRLPLDGSWPRSLRLPSRAELAELQRALTLLGFDTRGADGLAGPNTAAAIRAYQRANELPADGFATFDLLEKLRTG